MLPRRCPFFEGKILFQGTSEELASNPIVREKYLGRNFVFIRKKFDQPSTTEEVAMRAAAEAGEG